MTPRERIEAECARRGRAAVVAGCVECLDGTCPDPRLLEVLAGDTAGWYLAEPDAPSRTYWLRVWGARGLMWAMRDDDPAAIRALRSALADPHWRVREMGVKAAGRHGLGELVDELAGLRDDPVARVRVAAYRAIARIVQAKKLTET